MSKSIIFCLLVIAFFLSRCQGSALSKEISFQSRQCSLSEKNQKCDCIEQVLILDTNVFIRTSNLHSPSDFEYLSDCFISSFIFYGDIISLDSIYFSNIKNKKLVYAPGFVQGDYSENNGKVVLSLTFINQAINSTESTAHQITICYYKPSQKVESIKFEFLKD